MGERGSAHRASVIRIFAYAGYKRDEQERFSLSGACGWTKSSCSSRAGGQKSAFAILVPFFLFPGGEFWRARWAVVAYLRRASWSTREPGTLPCDRRRRPRASRDEGDQPVATTRPERAGLPGRRGKGSRDSLSFSFIGFYVQMTVGRRLSGIN